MTDNNNTKEELQKAMDEIITKAVEDETDDDVVVFESEAEETAFHNYVVDEERKEWKKDWEKEQDRKEKVEQHVVLIREWNEELANEKRLAHYKEKKKMKKSPSVHQAAISRSGWFLRIDSWDEKSHQYDYFKEYVHSLSDNTLEWLENESKETQMDFFTYCDRNPHDEGGFIEFDYNEMIQKIVGWIAAVSTVVVIGLIIYLVW